MLISTVFASLLLMQSASHPPQQTQPPPQSSPDTQSSELDDIHVEGRRRQEAAQAFVRSITNPIPGRKAAVWRDSICIGVGAMQPEAAQYMIDRIADWAASLGLNISPPGCMADVFIVATDDGDAMAQALVASRPGIFTPNVGDSHQGRSALAAFRTSGALIRWWHVSLAVNEDTGQPIKRLPGQPPFSSPPEGITRPSDLGVYGFTMMASRINSPSRDDLQHAFIIIDTEALDKANFTQISDFVAMVALAQIAPDASPENASILRLFNENEVQEETLSRWDIAYLTALYNTRQGRSNTSSNLSHIAGALTRDLPSEEAALDHQACHDE